MPVRKELQLQPPDDDGDDNVSVESGGIEKPATAPAAPSKVDKRKKEHLSAERIEQMRNNFKTNVIGKRQTVAQMKEESRRLDELAMQKRVAKKEKRRESYGKKNEEYDAEAARLQKEIEKKKKYIESDSDSDSDAPPKRKSKKDIVIINKYAAPAEKPVQPPTPLPQSKPRVIFL